MKNTKISLILALIATFLLSSVAVIAQDTTEVRISWWGSQTRHDLTIEAIELYEELNPDIDIVYEFQGWNDHWTKLATQAAGGQLPDIMQHDYARIEEWVDNGLLMPLDQYIEDGTIDTEFISDSSLAGGMVDGQMYGINLGNNSENITLDADKFAGAGLELPPVDWTWNDFEEIAMTLHEELGTYAMGMELTTEQQWKSLYMSCCDAWSYNDEGTALGYDDDQVLIDFYNMLLRLQEAGALQPYDEYIAMGDQGVESRLLVTEGAMGYFWSNQIVAVWNAAGEDRNFVMHTIPRVEGGQPANYIKPSMFFSITLQAEHPDEAAAFIDWFVNSVEANEILMAERGVPVSSVVREALLPSLGPAQAEMFRYLGVIEENNSPIRPADPAAHADIQLNVWGPEFLEPVMYGMITPEEGAQILREEATRILESQ